MLRAVGLGAVCSLPAPAAIEPQGECTDTEHNYSYHYTCQRLYIEERSEGKADRAGEG
jgi:hypothetical protein